jgi:hypothetical protein
MKAKRSSRKRRTLIQTNRVKNGVFLANEKQGNFSKRNLLGFNHLLQKIKLKTKRTDAPRKMHNA